MRIDKSPQLNRVGRALAGGWLELVVVAGAGLIGSFIGQLVAPIARRIVIIDFDTISETTTVLSPYPLSTVGRSKADVFAACLRRRFPHLETIALNHDVASLGAGLWRSWAGMDGVLVTALDNYPSVAHATRSARDAGMPAVVSQVGRDAVQVMVFTPDREAACYCCLGLVADESQPCLAAAQDAEETVSTPAVGAVAAGLAVQFARRASDGAIGAPMDTRFTFTGAGFESSLASIRRSRACRHHDPHRTADHIVSTHGVLSCWDEIAGSLPDPNAVLLPDSLPPVVPGSSESAVPLRDLGFPWWAIARCEISGRPAELELAGDREQMGMTALLEARDER